MEVIPVNKVAFISADYGRTETGRRVPGGSGWARCHQPRQALAWHGWETADGHAFGQEPDGWLMPLQVDVDRDALDSETRAVYDRAGALPTARRVPVVVVQRWMTQDAPDLIRQARAAGQRVINDVDDWYWGLHASNRAAAATDPKLNPIANRDHYARALQASSLVTVSTPFLQKRLRERFGVRSVVLRNAVDTTAYHVAPVRERADRLLVGWVGAVGWRSGDLETLQGVLDPFLASTRSQFVHHGVMPHLDTVSAGELAGVHSSRRGPTRQFVTPYEYPSLVEGFDIGVVPLTINPFNHAKSAIKGLEYAAAGIPFVAARTAEYELLESWGAGVTAGSPAEWAAALTRLADPSERCALRASGLVAAASQSWVNRWKEWADVYRSTDP